MVNQLESKGSDEFEKLRQDFEKVIDEAPVDESFMAELEENIRKLAASNPESIESDEKKPNIVALCKGFFSKLGNLLRF